MRFYFNTNRIRDVIDKNITFNYSELNGKVLKVECFQYLAKIYQWDSDEVLTSLDYSNLEHIFYMFCLPDFGKTFQPERIPMAQSMLLKLKKDETQLYQLLSNLYLNWLP